jgi:hypothetical protein
MDLKIIQLNYYYYHYYYRAIFNVAASVISRTTIAESTEQVHMKIRKQHPEKKS